MDRALVESLQSELHCDDLEPPAEASGWSAGRVRAWFEAGGSEQHDPELAVWLAGGSISGPAMPTSSWSSFGPAAAPAANCGAGAA